ncbi:hypothetical protein [Rickettsia endosymbiont of Gonocerus acuteangulatus]|uniref:hypothetical protein n=1 Tax=Rickettsia endosymbiont of Gonocerus acuteangulatus TaxID=3066266 RepID=UPI0031333C4B
MHILKAKEENIDGAIACSLSTNYPATWENTPTKDFLAKYNITNPYREDKIEQEEITKLDQKLTLINGKEVEFKKFLELLYKENTKTYAMSKKVINYCKNN